MIDTRSTYYGKMKNSSTRWIVKDGGVLVGRCNHTQADLKLPSFEKMHSQTSRENFFLKKRQKEDGDCDFVSLRLFPLHLVFVRSPHQCF